MHPQDPTHQPAAPRPARFVSTTDASRLTRALELTPEQLQQVSGGLALAAKCCKPDGGTCCPNGLPAALTPLQLKSQVLPATTLAIAPTTTLAPRVSLQGFGL